MARTVHTGRTLVLFRHAKSAWPDVPDHERPLARRGQRDAPAMGRWLSSAGYEPGRVLCSTARRARESWQLAQPALGTTPLVIFDKRVYQATAGELLSLLQHTPAAARILLVLGHDPGLPELAVTLAAADPPRRAGTGTRPEPSSALGRIRAKFPTAAIAVFECTGRWDQLDPGQARLVHFITPRQLAAAADPDSDGPRAGGQYTA